MKRSNSWRNLQKTFASTPISVTKKKRPTLRKSVHNPKSSVDDGINFHIEDSDEENVNCSEAVRRPPPFKKHKNGKSVKPLVINTSINSSNINNTTIWNSDTDESLSGEQPLRDVSECIVDANKKKARSKSLLFLTENEQNQLNSSKHSVSSSSSKQVATNKKPAFNISNMFNDTIASQSKDSDTIIESDSWDEIDSPQKVTNKTPTASKGVTRHLSSEIMFTQSTQRSNPVIESENSQFSLKFDLNTSVHKKKIKNKKHVKGGLIERLNKILNGNKSEFSFWMNERASDLNEPGQKLRIEQMERSYGRVLLHCSDIDADSKSDNNANTILCVDPAFKKLSTLQIGKMIEVAFDSHGYSIKDGTNFYPQISKILA